MRAGWGANLNPNPKAPTLTLTRLERAQRGERPRAQPHAAERVRAELRLVSLVDLALEIEPDPIEIAPVAQQLLEGSARLRIGVRARARARTPPLLPPTPTPTPSPTPSPDPTPTSTPTPTPNH